MKQKTSFLIQQLATDKNVGDCVVLCGHFALCHSDGSFSDHLNFSECSLSPNPYNEYCFETLNLGCELVANQYANRMLILVNDWQLLQKGHSQEFCFANNNSISQGYFDNNKSLPQPIMNLISSHKLNESQIEKHSPSQWMFSETNLRDEFVKYILELEKIGQPFENLELSSETINDTKIVSAIADDNDLAEFHKLGEKITLAHGNSTNCIGEIIYLLKLLQERGVKRFINIYPSVCSGFVNTATILSRSILAASGLEVINVAVPTSLDPNGIKIAKSIV